MNHTTVSTAAAADLSPLQAVIFDWAGTLVDFGSLGGWRWICWCGSFDFGHMPVWTQFRELCVVRFGCRT